MSTLVVCGGAVAYRRRILWCPICERRRRFVVAYDASPYYAPSLTCCGCGDSWSDGELGYRPFARGWRKAAIRKAKARWQSATAGPVELDDELYVIPDTKGADAADEYSTAVD